MQAHLSGAELAELRRLDVAHHLPAQSDYKLQSEQGGSRIIVRAEGCMIHDAEGHALLDGMAGLWCVNVGYGREELARAAYEQMLQLPFYNTFFRTATAPTIRLAAELAARLGHDLTHIFFNNSGSEANDTAFRVVRHYWALRGEPQRQIFISRWNAYHGSTVAAASLGGMRHMHAQGKLPIAGIEHVMQPYSFNEGFGEAPAEFAARAAGAIEARILEIGPENVAAFIGEPVQGAGGVIIPPEGYWPRVAAICRKYGILLIIDEVICGFGRLGRWFGFQHYGMKPDIVADLGHGALGAHRRGVQARGRRFRAWLHVLGPSDGRSGCAEESRNHCARGPRRARCARRGSLSCARSFKTGHSSARR